MASCPRDLKAMKEPLKLKLEYTCDVCKSSFQSKPKLLQHFKNSHFTVKIITESSTKGNCRRHGKFIHEQKFTECKICGEKLKSQKCLKLHNKSVHDPPIFKRRKLEVFPCAQCLKSFEGKSKLMRHVSNVHEKISNGKNYRCAKCSAVFTRRNALREHSFLHSPSKEIFSCIVCGQQFYTIAKLKFHDYTHNPLKIRCEICSKVFARQAALHKHQNIIHTVRNDLLKAD